MPISYSDLLNSDFMQAAPAASAPVNDSEAGKTAAAWADIAGRFNYALGSAKDREAVKNQFIADNKYGLQAINQQEGPGRSSLINLKNVAIESFRAAKDAVRLSNDVAAGKVDTNTATILAENALRTNAQYTPEPLMETQDTLGKIQERYAAASGFKETAGAVGLGLVDAAGEVVTNPEGVVQLTAQSAGHMLPPMAAAVTGAEVGTAVLPGYGTAAGAVGGFIGSLLGGLSVEAGARLIQEAGTELNRLGLEPTEANYAAVLADNDNLASMIDKSRKKAVGTALVDSVLSVGAAKIATAPLRRAQKEARLIAGADAPQEVVDALTRKKMAELSLGTKTKTHLQAYGTELASEPVSELTGQVAAGDEIDLGELAGELLGGIGASAVSKQVDTAVFGTKLATAGTVATAGVIPELAKAAVDTVVDAVSTKTPFRTQMDELHKGNAAFDYDNKVAAAVEAADVTEYADQAGDKYNPALAVDALAAINKTPATTYEAKAANLEQAMQVTSEFGVAKQARDDMREELETKNKDKTITKPEQVALRDLRKIKDKDEEYLGVMESVTKSMQMVDQPAAETKAQLQAAKDATTPEAAVAVLKQIFGSNGGKTIDSLGSSLEAIKANPATAPETVAFITDAQEFSAARSKLTQSYSNTTGQVHEDVLVGSDGYRSVDSYTKNIATALNTNNDTFAAKELSKLTEFAQHHRTKATVLRAITETVREGKQLDSLPADIQASFAAINKVRVANSGGRLKPYSIHKGSVNSPVWNATLDNMTLEADTLEQGLKVATGLFGLHQKSAPVMTTGAAVTSPVSNTAVDGTTTTATPASPVTVKPEASASAVEVPRANKETHTTFMQDEVHATLSDTSLASRIVKTEAKVNHPGVHPAHKAMFEAEVKHLKNIAVNRRKAGIPVSDEVKEQADALVESKVDTKPVVDGETARNGGQVESADSESNMHTKADNLGTSAEYAQVADQVVPQKEETKPITTTKPVSNKGATAEAVAAPVQEAVEVKSEVKEIAPPVAETDAAVTQEEVIEGNDYRGVNFIHKFMQTRDKQSTNLLQTMSNFFGSLREALDGSVLNELLSIKLDAPAENLIESMTAFHERLNKSADKIGSKLHTQFRYKNVMQFLQTDEGKLPENVLGAVHAAIYKWLATDAKDTLFNDDKAIEHILQLPADTTITPQARQLITELGMSQGLLSVSLGNSIYDLLNITPKEDAPANFEKLLKEALGLYALGAMEHEGLLTIKHVLTGDIDDTADGKGEKFGLDALKFNVLNSSIPDTKLHAVDKSSLLAEGSRKGKPTQVFYQVASNGKDPRGYLIPAKAVTDMTSLWRLSQDTWNELFNAPDTSAHSWVPYKSGKAKKIKGTRQRATEIQSDNTLNNDNMGWTRSEHTQTAFSFLDEQSQLDIAGFVNPENEHIDDRDSAMAANRGITEAIARVHEWTAVAAKQKSKNPVFYIASRIYRNLRMGMQGAIDPQGSKVHRYLFGMRGWSTTFKLDQGTAETADGLTMETKFLLAVGLSLGIESAKTGGVYGADKGNGTRLAGSLADTRAALATPVMQKAIAAIQGLIETAGVTDITPELMAEIREEHPEWIRDIVAGVKEGGENLHTFKGLVEYARFLLASEAEGVTEFTTDMPYEIDGMANGPTLVFFQMMAGMTNSTYRAMLRNQGIKFKGMQGSVEKHMAHRANMDAYEVGGTVWVAEIENIKSDLLAQIKTTRNKDELTALHGELQSMRVTQRLLGKFNDKEGFVNKTVRKMIKYRIMETLYGSGTPSLIKALTRELTENAVRGKLKAISKLTDAEEVHTRLQQLAVDVNTLANLGPRVNTKDRFIIPANVIMGGLVNKDAILRIQVPRVTAQAIYAQVEKGHGAALGKGIAAIYGDAMDNMKHFNKGYNINAALYNVARTHMIEARKAELIAANKLPLVIKENSKEFKGVVYADLSKADYAAIDARLEKVYPVLKTPFGGMMDMAKQDSTKNYAPGHQVEVQFGSKDSSKVQRKIGRITDNAKLKQPGVSPIAYVVQMMDGVISNLTQGSKIALLNTHDGFSTGLHQIDELGLTLNKNMYDTMANYDLLMEMHNSIEGSLDAFADLKKELAKEPGYDAAKFDAAITAEFTRFKIKGQYRHADGTWRNTTKKSPAEIIQQNLGLMKGLAAAIKDSKDVTLSYIDEVNQYHSPSGGYKPEHVNAVIKPEGLKILSQADEQAITDSTNKAAALIDVQEKNDADITEFTQLMAEHTQTLGSNGTNVSINAADYDPVIEINMQNVAATYDMIKDIGTVKASADRVHDHHLQRILFDIIGSVLDPADIYLKLHTTGEETAGRFVTEPGKQDKVFITSQDIPVSGMLNQGIRMSTGEVYAHELTHAITHSGLKMHARLRRQVEVLYRLAKKELDKDNKGFIHFLSDPNLDLNDPANTQEIADAHHRWDRIFGDKVDTVTVSRTDEATGLTREKIYSTHLDEFMAYGLTNASFIKALTPLLTTNYRGDLFKSDSWKGIISTNIQGTLVNIMNRITDMLLHSFTRQRPAANVALELERLAKRLAAIDSNNKTLAYTLLQKLEFQESRLAKYVDDKIKASFNKLNIVVGAKNIINEAKKKDTAFGQAVRSAQQKLDRMDQGIMQSMITQVKGLTDRVAPLHALITTRYLVIDKAQNEAAANTVVALAKMWQRELTGAEKTAITKIALKLDLTALREHFSMEEISALVHVEEDQNGTVSTLDKAMQTILDTLQQDPILKAYANHYNKQAQSLGVFMVNGEIDSEAGGLLNAHLIAGLHGTSHVDTLTATDLQKATALVDQLATMYGLQFSSKQQRETLHALMTEDMDAVEKVMNIHGAAQAEALTSLFGDNPSKIMKGYTADITNPYIQTKIGTKADQAKFAKEGYTISDRAIDRDPRDPNKKVPMYIYTSRTGVTNTLNASVFSFSRNRAKGTSGFQNTLNQGLDIRQAIANNKYIMAKKAAVLEKSMTTPFVPYDPLKPKDNYMIPKVDDQGKIVDYRYMMKEHTKDTLLEKNNDYDAVLGSMAGSLINKVESTSVNRNGVQALHDLYSAEYQDRPHLYIEVSPFSTHEWAREVYHLLPMATRKDMQDIWGDQKMYVAKDVMDMVFGTRKYSIVEAFGKTEQDRNMLERHIIAFAQYFFSDKALTRLSQVQSLMTSLTRAAKNNMIVKGFTTTLNNHLSNHIFVKSHGVSASNIIKWEREFISGMLQYTSDHKGLAEAQIHLTASKGRKVSPTLSQAKIDQENARLNSTIRQLNNRIALNPVTDAMDAGIMQDVVDDVDLQHAMAPYLSSLEQVGAKIESYLPAPIINLGKVMLMDESTQLYKILSNATKMTDGVGRYIMYKHYTGLPASKGRLSHKDAVAKVLHEFVNYAVPAHRMLDYFNTIGLVWFSKYALGVLRPLVNVVQEKPFEAIVAMSLAGAGGVSNIGQVIPFVNKSFINKDILDALSNPFTKYWDAADNIATLKVADDILSLF